MSGSQSDRPEAGGDDLGVLALAAARAGAEAIARVVHRGDLGVAQKSAAHDLVTTADRAAEEAVLRLLRAARPDDAVLAEESGRHAGSSGLRWLVDPLDGTANFVYRRADYAVSVAAEREGVPVAGAILRPADGRWVATSADGLRTSGAGTVSLGSPETGSPREALVSFGLPYALDQRRRTLALMGDLATHIRAVRVIGSAACDFLALVHGECDASVTVGLAEWDTAAGLALAAAAGGSWEHVDLTEDLRVLVAGPPPLVRRLAELVRQESAHA